MSYQNNYSWKEEVAHRDRKLQKIEKMQGLQALLATWEGVLEPDDGYIRDLKKRLRMVENQFNAMKP